MNGAHRKKGISDHVILSVVCAKMQIPPISIMKIEGQAEKNMIPVERRQRGFFIVLRRVETV